MSIKLHILNGSGELESYNDIIQQAFNEEIIRIGNKITLPNVDIVVADNPNQAIPETGVGGFAQTPNFISININPNFLNLKEVLFDEIQSTLAHELHHCVRMISVGYGTTLLEALITEGLADHFDTEINDGEPKPWDIAIQGKELERIEVLAEKEFDKTYNHFNWFFGSKDLNIPRWAGYSLGFDIVGKYLQKTSKKSSELVSSKAIDFIQIV